MSQGGGLRELDAGVCRLRGWRRGDIEPLAAIANDRTIWENLRDRFPHPYTRDDAADWVAARLAAPFEPIYAIDVDGALAGSVGLDPRTDIERVSSEIGYWLGVDFRGRGIATAAVRTLTRHAHDLGFTRVYATAFAENGASRRVLEKAGYDFEGIMRRAAIKAGVIRDMALYASTVD